MCIFTDCAFAYIMVNSGNIGEDMMVIKPVNLGGVASNCYLLKSADYFLLVDTGKGKRTLLEKELKALNCGTRKLKFIILTHGDFDHTGNCAYLRKKFRAKIAMHKDDAGMVEKGDMFYNRKTYTFLTRLLVNVLFGIKRFKPDITFGDGFDLKKYGFDAKIIHLPGHSKGSIGILTADGDLFCGDLFANHKRPSLSAIIDDIDEAMASVRKLYGYDIKTVYPGHGKPFAMNELVI